MSVILVPGLRGAAPDHWQERLARSGATHLPTERAPLDLAARVRDIEEAVAAATGPVVLVAHSAGVLTAAHWAATGSVERVSLALLVTPPTLTRELPAAYPRLAELRETGWLPIPQEPLPFPSRAILSDDDDLAPGDSALRLTRAWGATVVRAGCVGHANPAAGFGEWPQMRRLVEEAQARLPSPAGSGRA